MNEVVCTLSNPQLDVIALTASLHAPTNDADQGSMVDSLNDLSVEAETTGEPFEATHTSPTVHADEAAVCNFDAAKAETIAAPLDPPCVDSDQSAELDADSTPFTAVPAKAVSDDDSSSSDEDQVDGVADDNASPSAEYSTVGQEVNSDNEPEASNAEEEALDVSPDLGGGVDPEVLWKVVAQYLNRERLSKYRAGLLLIRLQAIYAKPGHGEFVVRAKKFALDWGISMATVYQRINFYKSVQKGRAELRLVCVTAEDYAKWGDFDDDDAFDRAAEEAASDAQVARMNALIAQAEAQAKAAVSASKNTAPAKSVKLEGLDTTQRKAIQPLIQKVTEAKGGKAAFSAWLFDMLVRESAMQTDAAAGQSKEVDANA